MAEWHFGFGSQNARVTSGSFFHLAALVTLVSSDAMLTWLNAN